MKKIFSLFLAALLFACPPAMAAAPSTSNYSYQIPTTGFSITVPNYVNVLVLNPAGTLASGTITTPAAPVDGQEMTLLSTQIVTALTLTPNTGQSLISTVASMAAGGAYRWVYNAPLAAWIPGGFAGFSTGAIINGGVTFTASGCSNSTPTGGASTGSVISGTTGVCTIVITINGAVGATAPNGWSCWSSDETTGNLFRQTASSTTTATLSGTTVTSDVITFGCIGY